MVSWYSCSLVLNSDSVSSMRLPRLASCESCDGERAQTKTSSIMHEEMSYTMMDAVSPMSLKRLKPRVDSLDRLLRLHLRRGQCCCWLSEQPCMACCSWWSPPTVAASPRFPPTSDCRSRRRCQMSRAWQQRSYLNNVCMGQGEGSCGEKERREQERREK